MTLLAALVFVVLSAIALMHALWGVGLRWPARDERTLVALVIGATGRSRMPSLPQCLLAAAAIFAAGLVALALAGLLLVRTPGILLVPAGVAATLVFLGRGLAAYLPAWRRRFAQQPFASLDTGCYGPLCLLLALAFAILLIGLPAGVHL